MENLNWDAASQFGDLRSVLDPHDATGLKNLLIDRMHWNAIKKHMPKSKKILDFGCGIGRFGERLDSYGLRYTGIDNSLGMIRAAREFTRNDKLNFVHFDGMRIPFHDSSFDVVLSSEVFTFILKSPSSKDILSEIRRVLVPGGRLIMLEQASVSGRKSESAQHIVTENDYVNALSGDFKINDQYKVRSPDFSKLACRLIDSKKIPASLFPWIVKPLARYESKLVNKAPEDYFKTTSYYDFLLDAVLSGK